MLLWCFDDRQMIKSLRSSNNFWMWWVYKYILQIVKLSQTQMDIQTIKKSVEIDLIIDCFLIPTKIFADFSLQVVFTVKVSNILYHIQRNDICNITTWRKTTAFPPCMEFIEMIIEIWMISSFISDKNSRQHLVWTE